MQALIRSDDVRSLSLVMGTFMIGFIATYPSPALVRVALVAVATAGISSWLLTRHEALDSEIRSDEAKATSLYSYSPSASQASQASQAPFAMLLHPEASSAVASLSVLSSQGRRASVHGVVTATENVVRAYHAILSAPSAVGQGRASAGTDDLRDRTIDALDALQTLRMETGSRGPASDIARSAEHRLRQLFVRFRQIASNKTRSPGLYGSPYPMDLSDRHSTLR